MTNSRKRLTFPPTSADPDCSTARCRRRAAPSSALAVGEQPGAVVEASLARPSCARPAAAERDGGERVGGVAPLVRRRRVQLGGARRPALAEVARCRPSILDRPARLGAGDAPRPNSPAFATLRVDEPPARRGCRAGSCFGAVRRRNAQVVRGLCLMSSGSPVRRRRGGRELVLQAVTRGSSIGTGEAPTRSSAASILLLRLRVDDAPRPGRPRACRSLPDGRTSRRDGRGASGRGWITCLKASASPAVAEVAAQEAAPGQSRVRTADDDVDADPPAARDAAMGGRFYVTMPFADDGGRRSRTQSDAVLFRTRCALAWATYGPDSGRDALEEARCDACTRHLAALAACSEFPPGRRAPGLLRHAFVAARRMGSLERVSCRGTVHGLAGREAWRSAPSRLQTLGGLRFDTARGGAGGPRQATRWRHQPEVEDGGGRGRRLRRRLFGAVQRGGGCARSTLPDARCSCRAPTTAALRLTKLQAPSQPPTQAPQVTI